MIKQKIKAAGSAMIVSLLSSSYASAYSAEDNWDIAPQNPGGLPDDLELSILNVIDWLLGFIALLAVLMIIYGGMVYVSSSGDQERVASARKTIKYALMGLALAGIAYASVNLIIGVLQPSE